MKMRRIAAWLSALLLCFLTVSCGEPVENPNTEIGAVIASDYEYSEFCLIYPADWTDATYTAAKALNNGLKAHYGSVPKFKSDTEAEDSGSYEILVGNTNRPESTEALDGLNDYGWRILVSGKKIAVNAKTDAMISEAVSYFLETYAGKSEPLGIGLVQNKTENNAKYDSEIALSVNGISAYTISYASDAGNYLKSSASEIAGKLQAKGISILAKSGKITSGKTVKLTTSGNVLGYEISFDADKNITVTGKTEALAVVGLRNLSETMLQKEGNAFLLTASSKVTDAAEGYVRDDWNLAIPAFDGGTLASAVYDCGDSVGSNGTNSYLEVVSGAIAGNLDDYADKLQSFGFSPVRETSLDAPNGKQATYFAYQKGDLLVFVSYNGATKEAKIIEDRSGVTETAFAYESKNPGLSAEVVLYGLQYSETGVGDTNNGMLMLLGQNDGSVTVIDGGGSTQATNTAAEGLLAKMREMTCTAADEKIRINCWIITHAHDDHQALMTKVLSQYGSQVVLERVLCNFPSATSSGLSDISDKATNAIEHYAPDALVLKAHTGQSIRLGDLTLDVLFTHEDMVDSTTGKTKMTAGNDASTVIRVTLPDGNKLMVLGDTTIDAGKILLKNTDKAELKCQIVQVAHHGYNLVTDLYTAVGAKYALWPQISNENFNPSGWHKEITDAVQDRLNNAGAQYHYYAGKNTVTLISEEGVISVKTESVVK